MARLGTRIPAFPGGVIPSPGSQTYSTPGEDTFTVPAGVYRLLVQLWGGGASAYAGSSGPGGDGMIKIWW